MSEQFDLMGRSYEDALRAYPDFRQEELDYIFGRLDLRPGLAVLDFTAGSGFVTLPLLRAVGPTGRVVAVDASAVMLGLLQTKLPDPAAVLCIRTTDPTFPELRGQEFDRIVSLGGFHHVEHQVQVCRELYRMLRPGGRALLLDFADGTLSQEHFDGLVHRYNPEGHLALFLSRSRARNLAHFAGCATPEAEVVRFTWSFPSVAAAGEFFVKLHGLRCTPGQAADIVRTTFGLPMDGAGRVDLPFDYVALHLHKPG